jgi:hypothetical protein
VHFHRQPGVADAVFDEYTEQFLMWLIDLAQTEAPLGEPVMSDDELAVTVAAFQITGRSKSGLAVTESGDRPSTPRRGHERGLSTASRTSHEPPGASRSVPRIATRGTRTCRAQRSHDRPPTSSDRTLRLPDRQRRAAGDPHTADRDGR